MNQEQEKLEDMEEDVREGLMNQLHDAWKENGREKNDYVPTGEIIDSPTY